MNKSRLHVEIIVENLVYPKNKVFLQRSDVSRSEVYTNFASAARSKSLYTVAVEEKFTIYTPWILVILMLKIPNDHLLSVIYYNCSLLLSNVNPFCQIIVSSPISYFINVLLSAAVDFMKFYENIRFLF